MRSAPSSENICEHNLDSQICTLRLDITLNCFAYGGDKSWYSVVESSQARTTTPTMSYLRSAQTRDREDGKGLRWVFREKCNIITGVFTRILGRRITLGVQQVSFQVGFFLRENAAFRSRWSFISGQNFMFFLDCTPPLLFSTQLMFFVCPARRYVGKIYRDDPKDMKKKDSK